MTDAAAASKAVANGEPIIDGRRANVNLAYIGAKPRPRGQLLGIIKLLVYLHC